MPAVGRLGDAQRLAQRRFELVGELVDAHLQPLVLVDERVADQHARHPLVLLGKTQQHHDHLLRLRGAVLGLGLDLVDEREHRRLDELDQALEHLRLAREMAVERRFRHIEPRRQRRGRDLLAARGLEHGRKRLQDLQAPLAGLRRGASRCVHHDVPRAGTSSARIIVPTPSLVSTSSSSAWSTRPSMMCELLTPLRTASSADPILGSMPPWIVPSAKSASIPLAVSPVSSLPLRSSTPTVFVISTSFSARSVSASLPATRSALMLYASPSAPTPIGAITGMKSRESSRLMSSGSMRSISPTRPMSTSCPGSASLLSSSLRARMNAPSCPVRPTALPPCWLMSPTISWLSSPSTISTTFITFSSVTRMPWRNSLRMPIRVSRSPICGPPPWTITGFMPTSFSMTTSRAKPAFRCASVIALPPYLTTIVRS